MDSVRATPFHSNLSRDDYSALEQVSRGIATPPHISRHLSDLGLVTKALGNLVLTQKGAMLLVAGPVL